MKVTAAYNAPKGKAVYEKLDLVTETAEAVRVSDDEVRFNGTWYKTDLLTTDPNAGDDCEYVEVNGYIFYLDGSTNLAGAEDFVVVTAAASNTSGIDNTITARVLKDDGSETEVEVSKVGGNAVTANGVTKGTLYMYEIDEDGYYELTAAESVQQNDTDFDTWKTSDNNWVNATSNLDAYVTNGTARHYIADNAVVFVNEGDGDYSVTTGERLKRTNSGVTVVTAIGAVDSSSSGVSEITLAYVTASSLSQGNDTYAYVAGDVEKYRDGDDYYVSINIGNDETLTTVSGVDTSGVVEKAYNLAKGNVFKYTLNSEGKVDDITVYDMGIMVAADATEASGDIDFHAAITGYYGKNITFNNHLMKADGTIGDGATTYNAVLTDDTVIIYVDSTNNSVAEGGSIQLASGEEINGDKGYYANAMADVDAANEEIQLLVIDVNNDILNIQ